MDENLNDIDNLFKKAVQTHAELPSVKAWEHLEKDLQKRNMTSMTKKYKKWRWLASLLFIFFVGIVMYSFHITWRYNTAVKKMELNNNHLKNTGSSLPNKGNSSRHADQIKSDNLITATTRIQENIADTISKNQTVYSKTTAKNETIKSKDKNLVQSIKPIFSISHITEDKSSSGEHLKNNISKMAPANETSKLKVTKETSKAKRTSVNTEQHMVVGTGNVLADSEDPTGNAHSIGMLPIQEEVDLIPATVQTPLYFAGISPYIISSLFNSNSTNPDIAAAEKKLRSRTNSRNRQIYTTAIVYSWDKVFNQVAQNHPDFKEDNYAQIKNHEKNSVSNSIGFSLVRTMGRSWGIESGIGQTIYITDINAKPLVARRDNSGNINYRISTSSGYAYYAIKSIPRPAMADSIRTLTSKSTVKYISVPLGLLYYFNFRRISLVPALLVSANFKTSGKIETVQSAEHTYSNDIEGLKSKYFDGTVRLSVSSNITKTIGISLTPFARFALSGVTTGNPVTTRRNAIGLAAGLNYHF